MRRALHFVFKISNRKATIDFYRNVLGMKVLRHEEFAKGCEAACNGPYDGKWSKTMIGYGSEDDHFVVELTYNYGIKNYKLGNDFKSILIASESISANAKVHGVEVLNDGSFYVCDPDGYKFCFTQKPAKDPMRVVTLASSNLQRSIEYWHGLLQMNIYAQDNDSVTMGYSEDQCSLRFVYSKDPIDRAEAFGRIAFSCPSSQLRDIESKMINETILTPYVSLDTPGKATVQVVILADPDEHEICFVGDEGFRELSRMDPNADALLNKAIADDKSDEWFSQMSAKK